MKLPSTSILLLLIFGLLLPDGNAQTEDSAHWADTVSHDYIYLPNLTYSTEGNIDLKADIYQPVQHTVPGPVVVTIHGGGLVDGSKESYSRMALPFLQMGLSVVNIEYRLARAAHAPAAVEDARCALYWIAENAGKYAFDANKIVTVGSSSGGHLALISAMLRPEDGFDFDCRSAPDFAHDRQSFTVAAVISWSGVTNEEDSLTGPNARKWAQIWIGNQPDRDRMAKSVSPVFQVRPGLPPILLIHGTADPVVPYAQALQLHEALDRDHDPNQLLTLPGGGHVSFFPDQWQQGWDEVRTFLKTYNLLPAAQSQTK